MNLSVYCMNEFVFCRNKNFGKTIKNKTKKLLKKKISKIDNIFFV